MNETPPRPHPGGRRFMPGARIHSVDGVGTFAVFGVANGRGSAGVHVQYAPVGTASPSQGFMAFKLALTSGRDFEIRAAGGRESFPPAVEEAALALADREIRGDDNDLFFNLLSACDAEIRDYDEKRAQLRSAADGYAWRLMRGQTDLAGDPLTHDRKERLERTALDYERDEGPRATEIRAFRDDLREWSGVPQSRPLGEVLQKAGESPSP